MSENDQTVALNYLRSIFPDIEGKIQFTDAIKSGVLLCNLANKLIPNSITKIDLRQTPFVFCANIAQFNTFCRNNGFNDTQLPAPVSLVESEEIALQQVISILYICSQKYKIGKWVSESMSCQLGSQKSEGPSKKDVFLQAVKTQSEKTYITYKEVGKINIDQLQPSQKVDAEEKKSIPDQIDIREREKLIQEQLNSKIRTDVELKDDFKTDKNYLKLEKVTSNMGENRAPKEQREDNQANEARDEKDNKDKKEKKEKPAKEEPGEKKHKADGDEKKQKDPADKKEKAEKAEKPKKAKKAKEDNEDDDAPRKKEKKPEKADKDKKAEKDKKPKKAEKTEKEEHKKSKAAKDIVYSNEKDFELPDDENDTYEASVCITGFEKAGKSSLLFRMLNGTMDQYKQIEAGKLKISDTLDDKDVNILLSIRESSQEDVIRASDIVIFCFDITNREQFDQLQQQIDKIPKEKFLVLCGCLSDKEGVLDSPQLQSIMYLDSGFRGFKFLRVCALTGSGVSKLFGCVGWSAEWMKQSE